MLNIDLIRQSAIGNWPYLLQSAGIDAGFLRDKHGPCPVCGGTDRFRFDDQDGRGSFIYTHCGAGDGFALLSKFMGTGFIDTAKQAASVLGIDTGTSQPVITYHHKPIAVPAKPSKDLLGVIGKLWLVHCHDLILG